MGAKDEGHDLLGSIDTIEKFLLHMLENFSREGDPERISGHRTVSNVHYMHIQLHARKNSVIVSASDTSTSGG